MPRRVAEGVDFIRWAPGRQGGQVSLVVTPLDASHAGIWDREIQPIINGIRGRADVGWKWRWISAVGRIGGALQKPAAFAVCVPHEGIDVPCALVQLVAKFPSIEASDAECVFLWYLADAPQEALGALLPASLVPKMLGTIGLDVAVSHSFRAKLRGRTALHAAHEGGDRLTSWYAAQGMENHPAKASRPSLFRPNDGRYFFYTPEGALRASQALDKFRRAGA